MSMEHEYESMVARQGTATTDGISKGGKKEFKE